MKKTLAKVLLFSLIISLVVLPIAASDFVDIGDTYIHFTLHGNGGSDNTNPCRKASSGSGSVEATVSREQAGVYGTIRIRSFENLSEVTNAITVSASQTSIDRSYSYKSGYGYIDDIYYLQMTASGGSSAYDMRVDGTFTP